MKLQSRSPPYPPANEDLTFPWAFGLGQYPVAVYGLGKMGLPLAAVFAEATGSVTGVDIDETVVDGVNAGRSHVDGEPGLDDLVADTVERGSLRATTDGTTAARDAAIHVVVVPTLVADGEPDLSLLDAAIDTIASGLSAGDVVFVECTVPPRTCVDHVRPRLASKSGLDPDAFGLAFCPERTMSGRALEDIRGSYPKIVGGVDAASTKIAERVYHEINDAGVITVADATTAEAVKVFEGLYRDVNIALANELAQFTDDFGIDVREAIETANTQPFCDIHEPGAGVGGHCIPYYPYFVMGSFDREAPLLRTARAVNDGMPVFVAEKVLERLAATGRWSPDDATVATPAGVVSDGETEQAETSLTDGGADAEGDGLGGRWRTDDNTPTVAVLGLTYRPGVEEVRATPARPIADRLDDAGVNVLGVDPLVDELEDFPHEIVAQETLAARDVDGVVLVTAHDAFGAIDWAGFDRDLVVVDGRDALDPDGTRHDVYTIGVGQDVQ